MSTIKKKFYNIFWKEKSCRNLFLLSKEELLDSHQLTWTDKPIYYSHPRIIVSNTDRLEEGTLDIIRFRTDNHNYEMEGTFEQKMEQFEPILKEFYETKLKKRFSKFITTIEERPFKLLVDVFFGLIGDNLEDNTIELMQKYELIGQNINNFEELKSFVQKEFLSKKNELITEDNIIVIETLLSFAKNFYANHAYQRLYNSNQILVGALHEEDDFSSRIRLFRLLYESKIISASNEDAFVECTSCEAGVYRGIFNIRIAPDKLKNLKCPICANPLNYFVPYSLHPDIYKVVKQQDGLLLDALCEILNENGEKYQTNVRVLDDIEIDCLVYSDSEAIFIECKMYQSTSKEKIKSKLKKHFFKLLDDYKRLEEKRDGDRREYMAVLLVNISDTEFLRAVEEELYELSKTNVESIRIENIISIRDD